MIRIDEQRSIPDQELDFETSRSGGPGGQNVDKVETRVTLRFDVAGSPSLSPGDKARVLAALAGRISKGGVLRVTARAHRTQAANRKLAADRFAELLREALEETPERRPSRPPRSAHRRRLEAKRRRGRRKRERSATGEEGEG